MNPAIVDFTTYPDSVARALEQIRADQRLAGTEQILIKPNLVTSTPFPVTTPARCCEAVIDYCRWCNPSARIVIAEGTGDPAYTTHQVFDFLGYTRLAARKNIALVDLNTEPVKKLKFPDCTRLPEYFLPEIALSHFIISIPVLKAHTLAGLTGTLKNMMGFAPPAHYSGGGAWNKAALHTDIQAAICDLNRYRCPDLTVMDASVGMADSHLGGRQCDPPAGKIIAGFSPLAVDRLAAELLNLDWRRIGHLQNTAP